MIKKLLNKSYRIIKREGIKSFINRVNFKLKYTLPLLSKNNEIEGIEDYKVKILYIVGCLEGESKRYRVFNLIEAMQNKNVYAEWKYEIDKQLNDQMYIEQFDIIVLFRAAYSDNIEKIIKIAKKLSIPTVFDVDDLVFDDMIVDKIDGIKNFTYSEREEYLSGVRRYNQTFVSCDYATSSTEYLAKYMCKKGKKAYVIKNSLNNKQIQISQNLNISKNNDKIILGYLSGSKTHNKDFEQVVNAIKRIMSEYDNVFLRVIGYLDIENYMQDYIDRVEKKDFVKWEDLCKETYKLDINLAPLEMNNEFCEGKSELKYFESALVGVPTIASATDTFNICIKNNVNGLLCENKDDWYIAIKRLIEDHDLYNMIVNNSKEHIKNIYYPEPIGNRAIEVYTNIIMDYKKKNLNKESIKINWIVPEPFEASGGHRNIFRTIKYLSGFGHRLSVYIEPTSHRFTNSKDVEQFIKKNFMDLEAEVFLGTKIISQCDVLFATHWSTAYIVKKNEIKSLTQCYFIQDYEPYFYEMGYDYILAKNTYELGFQHITSGPWCTHLIEKEFNVKSSYFRFPIDRNIYYSGNISNLDNNKLKIIYFARPDMSRRCYPLGVEALKIIKGKYPECEIIFYGSEKSKYSNIPFEFTNLGILPKLSDLGNLYREANIGIVFSTTNPSLVPYEMMACGCPVIDLNVNDNQINYGSYENAMLVNPNPKDIAEGIEKLITDDKLRNKIIENGLEYCNIFPTEEEMVRKIECFIKEGLNNKLV